MAVSAAPPAVPAPKEAPKGASAGLKVASALVPRGNFCWTAEARLPMFTISDIPLRMTIVGLPKRGQSPKKSQLVDLLVYSPFYPTEELMAQIKAIGTVKYIVAPNSMHHLYAGDFKAAYPGSKLLATASLKAKRPDLAIDNVFPSLPSGWPSDALSLSLVPFLGEELVLLHKPSRSLVVADLAFNFAPGGDTPLPTGTPVTTYLYLASGYRSCCLTTPFKWLIKDAAAVKVALEEIVKADFDQLVVAHGSVVPTGGKEAFKAGTLDFITKLAAEQQAIQEGKGLLGLYHKYTCSVHKACSGHMAHLPAMPKLPALKLPAMPKLQVPDIKASVHGLQEQAVKHPYHVAGGLAAATVLACAIVAVNRK